MHQKKSCLSEFFSAKSFVLISKKFRRSRFGQSDGFLPLTIRLKNQILAVFAFSACSIRHCSHSRPHESVHLASLEFFDTFFTGGSTRKFLIGSWSEDLRKPIVIIGKYVCASSLIWVHFVHSGKLIRVFWILLTRLFDSVTPLGPYLSLIHISEPTRPY